MRQVQTSRAFSRIRSRFQAYFALIKSLQTALLLITGLAGYASVGHLHALDRREMLGLAGSLFLAISGSTMLNMWYDRDIDARMDRTCLRPLPSKQLTPHEVLILGTLVTTVGVGCAFLLSPLCGAIVLAGAFFDVVVYTIWLKRRSPWSILWGGISGAMPVLAGRALALGHLDGIGILLAAAILFWIPTHILTFAMKFAHDYARAGVPTVPGVYGFSFARVIIAISSLLASAAMLTAAWQVGITAGGIAVMVLLAVTLLILALTSVLRPSQQHNTQLFKFASLYMLISMVMIAL